MKKCFVNNNKSQQQITQTFEVVGCDYNTAKIFKSTGDIICCNMLLANR